MELENAPAFDSRAFMPILPFFREFREADIDALADRAQQFSLPKGVTLFEEREGSDSLFIVLRGALSLYCIDEGDFYPLGIVGPGKVCGADDLIASRPRACGSMSSSEATLLEIPAAEFGRLIGDRSWLSFRFQGALCDALLESLASANRRLSHEVTHTSMMEHRAIASLVPPLGRAAS
jgi:CRP-like cAMP-binding protein